MLKNNFNQLIKVIKFSIHINKLFDLVSRQINTKIINKIKNYSLSKKIGKFIETTEITLRKNLSKYVKEKHD